MLANPMNSPEDNDDDDAKLRALVLEKPRLLSCASIDPDSFLINSAESDDFIESNDKKYLSHMISENSLEELYQRQLHHYQDKEKKVRRRKWCIILSAIIFVLLGVTAIFVELVINETEGTGDKKSEFEFGMSVVSDNISTKHYSKVLKQHRCDEIRAQNIDYFTQEEDVCSRNKHPISDPVKNLKCQMLLTALMFCDWETKTNIIEHHHLTNELEFLLTNQSHVNESNTQNNNYDDGNRTAEICSVESIISNEGFGACESICSSRACCFVKGDFECCTFAPEWCEVFNDCENLLTMKPSGEVFMSDNAD